MVDFRNKIGYILFLCLLVSCGQNAEKHYNKGRSWREQNEPIAAMKSFIAATQSLSHNYAIKGRSYSNMATMCRICERHDLAYTIYEKSAEEFHRAKDTTAYAYALNNMAWELAVQGQKEQAIVLADSACKVSPSNEVHNKTIETRAAACLYRAEYDSTIYYANIVPIKSVYFDILKAQAYTFKQQCDSAMFYAKRVAEQTNNPRYLDNVYYILSHCDSIALVEEVRALADTRSDIQRGLERNDAEWIEAMLLAEQHIQSPQFPIRWTISIIAIGILIIVITAIILYYAYNRSLLGRERQLAQQCKALRHDPYMKEKLRWDVYSKFCIQSNTLFFNIADKLKQCELTEREIRICVLVLIGLSYAEIAEVLYRAESGIGKDKYLIAKRLGVSAKDLRSTLWAIACKKGTNKQ